MRNNFSRLKQRKMQEFTPETQGVKLNINTIVFVVIVLFLLYSLFVNARLYLKARAALIENQKTLIAESDKKDALQRELSRVERNSFVEEVAYDTLGLSREGEIVLILPPEEEVKRLSPRLFGKKEVVNLVEIPNWKKWLQLFI